MTKWVYSFGAGDNEGRAEMRNLLGGKGANLAEMASSACRCRPASPSPPRSAPPTTPTTGQYPADLAGQVDAALARIEQAVGPEVRRRAQAAAGLGPLRRARLDARHDGHRAQPRPQRRHRRGPGRSCPATRASPGTAIAASSRCTATWCSASTITASRRSSSTPSRRAASVEDTALTAEDWQQRGRPATRKWSPSETGKPFPQDPRGAALGRHRRRVRQLDEPARQHLSPAARHPGRLGHRGQRAGDGVRQHGRRLRHRRRASPATPRPARTCSTASTWSTPRARTWWPASARRSRWPSERAKPGEHADGRGDAGGLRRAAGRSAQTLENALPGHAGHRVHRPARQALHAADPQRQAHRRGRAAHRRRDGAARG